MFKSLKEKLSGVIKKFSKESEEVEVKPEDKKELVEEQKKETKKPKTTKKKETKKEDSSKEPLKNNDVVKEKEVDQEITTIEEKENIEKPEGEKKGFFGSIKEKFTKFTLDEEKFEEIFWELELGLLENNCADEVIQKIKEDLKVKLLEQKLNRKNPGDQIKEYLRESFQDVFFEEDLLKKIKSSNKPFKIAMIGINGSGKTTTLAKLTNLFLKHKLSVVVAASDTFRAAAIQQLETHTNNLGVKLIKQDYNSDPAAVAFDALKHAKSKNIDIVLIDTAGRLHSNENLMAELKKIDRVCELDYKIFVGEAITGNDCIEQAKTYNELIGIDGIILSKLDVDEKGGAALSVSYITKKPILYFGVGQNYEDLEIFDKQKIINNILEDSQDN